MTSGRHRLRPATVLYSVLNNQELVNDVLDELAANELSIVLARPAHFQHPNLTAEDGEIGSRQLIEAAAIYDEISLDENGDGATSAGDFISWFLVEVKGSPEAAWRVARRKGEAA